MIQGLHHVAILCSDREKSLNFYRAIGFEIVSCTIRPERCDEIINMQGHSIALELFISNDRPQRVTDPEAYGLRHIAFCVYGLDELNNFLNGCGYSPEPIRKDSFTGEKMFFVKDPDGLPIEFREEKSKENK